MLSRFSCVQLFATPWNVSHQASQSIEFSRQEYWIGWPFPFPENLSNPGFEHGSSTLQADSLPSEAPGKPIKQFKLYLVSIATMWNNTPKYLIFLCKEGSIQGLTCGYFFLFHIYCHILLTCPDQTHLKLSNNTFYLYLLTVS